jgi:PAS domain S-box-containing protein
MVYLLLHDIEAMESNEETHIRISEVIRDGKAEFETLQRTKKGEIRNVSVKAQIIQVNGDPVYYCIWRDVTKQKQVQLALHESENRYRTMFENCLTGILITHPDGSINAANPEACRLLGRSEADICKAGRDGVMNLNDPHLAMALSERQRSGRFHGELSMVHKDGTIFPVEIVSNSFTDSEGQIFANIIFLDITSRRRIEVALRESEANLNALFNATDVDEILMALNESGVQRMGRPREELIGCRLNDLLPADVLARRRPFISHALLTGERVKFEDERDGCWTANNLYPILGDANKIERLAIFSRDITDQIHASEALRLSEERQRFILDSLPIAIFTSPVNPEIDTSWISGNVKSITGFEAAEYISENYFWRKRIHPEDREHILNAYAKLSGRAENLPEYRWKCSDGVYHWFQDRSILLENEYRKEFLGVIIDITERKTAEIILKESEAKFRSLVETTNDVIWETNKEGLFTYLSPQIKDVLGYEWQELLGHSPFEFMPDDESKVIRKRSDDIIASGKSFNGLINVSLHKDGRRIIFETSGVPNFDSNNNYIGYRGIDRDITESKRAEEEINLLNTVLEQRVKQRTFELENANKELDAFAYSVSHNLRSPLRGIDGWSMALLEDYNHLLDEQGRTYLGRVRNEVQQMASLIDDLLKLARVSRVERLQNDVDISGLVQTISNQFILANPKRMFEFIIEPGLTVSGDLSMLQIVLTNLLDNACKFTGQNPVAHIEFGKQLIGGKAVFFIRDNGVGFNMENSKNLFGAFQRMHKPSEYPGSGIGLATVHRIITRHGGRIWAESKPGEGAVFYFTIS